MRSMTAEASATLPAGKVVNPHRGHAPGRIAHLGPSGPAPAIGRLSATLPVGKMVDSGRGPAVLPIWIAMWRSLRMDDSAPPCPWARWSTLTEDVLFAVTAKWIRQGPSRANDRFFATLPMGKVVNNGCTRSTPHPGPSWTAVGFLPSCPWARWRALPVRRPGRLPCRPAGAFRSQDASGRHRS